MGQMGTDRPHVLEMKVWSRARWHYSSLSHSVEVLQLETEFLDFFLTALDNLTWLLKPGWSNILLSELTALHILMCPYCCYFSTSTSVQHGLLLISINEFVRKLSTVSKTGRKALYISIVKRIFTNPNMNVETGI